MESDISIESEPLLERRYLVPVLGMKRFVARKNFFYSSKGYTLKLAEQIRLESRHLLLTTYNCGLVCSIAYGAVKGLEYVLK